MGDERRPSSRERPRSREQQQQQQPTAGPRVDPAAVCEAEGVTVPSIPGRLGTYNVSKAVGKGGYAIVYKATRKSDGKIVAIKRVEIFEMTPKKRERCLQEVELLKQLTHPNVIQMLDAFIDENQLIIVFEWAPAGDLKRLIKRCAESGKALEESAIWEYFFQIADALRYMHANRIMHRDIKPANVLVGAGGALKLGDLGLGRQFSEHTLEAFSKVGTPYYVSPEVVKGGGYDWKSDVWSLGCLLYELAALRSPFEMEGANLYDVFQKISRGTYSPLPADQWSEQLRKLVASMLQTDPAARPELEEVWAATRDALHAQAQSKEDTHVLSERCHSALLLLSAEARIATSLARPSPLTPAPLATLGAVHPLFFATPLSRTPSPTSTQAINPQQQQLGTLVQLVAWLTRACGKPEPARDLLSLLDTATNSVPNLHHQQPSSGTPLPVCSSSPVRAAEAIQAAAASLRIKVDAAPVSQLALGHGRAVVWLVEQVALVALQRLGICCLPPQHKVGQGQEEAVEIDNLDDGASMLPQAEEAGHSPAEGEGEEEAYYGIRQATGSQATSSGSLQQASNTKRSAAAMETLAAAAGSPLPHVDPVIWRMELERLMPRLSAIRLEAGSQESAWVNRWTQVKQAAQQLRGVVPGAAAGLLVMQRQVADDLQRVVGKESRLTASAQHSLGVLREAQQRVEQVQARVRQRQEEVAEGAAALQHMGVQLQGTQLMIEHHVEGLDGTRQVRAIKEAITQVRAEVHHMDLRMGLAAQQLLRQRRPVGLLTEEGASARMSHGGSSG